MKKYLIGFSLIEVLISLLILSFILLGFDAMELIALRKNREAYFLSIANQQLYNMLERLSASGQQADINQQINLWNQENTQVLPNGKGYVIGHYPSYNVTIFWGEKTSQSFCHFIELGEINCLSQDWQP